MLPLLYVFITCNTLKYIERREYIECKRKVQKKNMGHQMLQKNFMMYITFTLYHFKPLFNFSF